MGNFNNLARDYFNRDPIMEQISTTIGLLSWMKDGGRLKPVDGGEQFDETMMSSMNSAKWITKSQSLDMADEFEGEKAVFDPKILAVPLVFFKLDTLKNSGQAKLFDLFSTKKEMAKIRAEELLEDGLFTSNAADTNAFFGLGDSVADDGSGTYGGIDTSTDTWYQNQAYTTSTNMSSGTPAAGIMAMFALLDLVRKRSQKADLVVTTSAIMRTFEGLITSNTRYGNPQAKSERAVRLGLDHLMCRDAPMIYSDSCVANHAYALNTKFIRLQYYKGEDFKVTDFQEGTTLGQLSKAAILSFIGAMTCNARRLQGVATTIVA